jgi:methionine-rich copper-binding protein CopC
VEVTMTLSLVVRGGCLGLTVAVLSLAAAHAADSALQVVSRSPAKDQMTSFPRQIHLTFNGPIKPASAQVDLLDPDGRRIRLAGPTEAKDGLTVTPEPTGGPPVDGPYELSWKAQSAAGSQGSGRYTFFVQ